MVSGMGGMSMMAMSGATRKAPAASVASSVPIQSAPPPSSQSSGINLGDLLSAMSGATTKAGSSQSWTA